jgi:aspartate kinase
MRSAAMPVVVQKYGGSSVADVAKIQRVAAHVVATAGGGERVVVVVSAMGDTTDELLALARAISAAPPRRELDMLVSCGERIAMALLAMAIQELGQQAISFTGSQSGIITDDRHSGARIIEVRPSRIEAELELGKIVIVAGFQGVSRQREVTTLGRGGSDTTAVALAAALGAVRCEIMSDVEGVWTGDPRVVTDARRLETVSYEEMFELAEHGAKVLNQQAVSFAQRSGIVIHARKTGSEGPGTRVEAAAADPALRRATGVASAAGLVRVAVAGPGAPDRLCGALGEHRVPLRQLSRAADRASALFALDDVPDWSRVRAVLVDMLGPALTLEEDLGTATVVGHGIGADAAAVALATAAIAALDTPIRGLEVTPLRITFVLDAAAAPRAAAALHAAFLA